MVFYTKDQIVIFIEDISRYLDARMAEQIFKVQLSDLLLRSFELETVESVSSVYLFMFFVLFQSERLQQFRIVCLAIVTSIVS